MATIDTVVYCEKPSQGMDVSNVLGIVKRERGYNICKNDTVVTWGIGHLMKTLDPDHTKEAWAGRWGWPQLPMLPDALLYEPNPKTKDQLKVATSLIKQAKRVVIGTDSDREGEVLARLVLDYCKFKGRIDRLWLSSSLLAEDIKKAWDNLLPGAKTFALYEAGMARSFADWTWGYNLTRGTTVAANAGATFPVGRVQTAALFMIVSRDLEIETFVSREFFELEAKVRTVKGHELTLSYAPGEEKRIFDKAAIQALKEKAEKAQGPLKVTKSKGKDGPDLPFSLTTLQEAGSSVMGLSGMKTLELAQSLYDKKYISYPRSEQPYLPSTMETRIDGILDAITHRLPKQVAKLEDVGIVVRKSVFNDGKLGKSSHHGIIPMPGARPDTLSGAEAQLYDLIAVRFLQTLGPDRLYDATRIEMDANGVPLSTSGRVVTDAGWTAIRL